MVKTRSQRNTKQNQLQRRSNTEQHQLQPSTHVISQDINALLLRVS